MLLKKALRSRIVHNKQKKPAVALCLNHILTEKKGSTNKDCSNVKLFIHKEATFTQYPGQLSCTRASLLNAIKQSFQLFFYRLVACQTAQPKIVLVPRAKHHTNQENHQVKKKRMTPMIAHLCR